MLRINPSSRGTLAALLLIVVFTSGCQKYHRVSPTELEKLDGYEAGQRSHEISDLDGDTFEFGRNVYTTLHKDQVVVRRMDAYESIQIEDSKFVATTTDGERIEVQLDGIERVDMKYTSGVQTGLVVAAGSLLVVGGFVAIFLVSPPLGG